MNEGTDFLKKKYNLHNAPEVQSVARRKEMRTGEKLPQKPADQIQNYLNRFKEIIERTDPEKREMGLWALKEVMYRNFVIKPETIPEEVFLLEQRIAREQGHGHIEITDEFKEQKTAQIINNQRQSLDRWVDYLASGDAQYPDWAKYWAFRSMLEMGKLVKETGKDGTETARFQKRSADTVASFPTLNPRALALTIGALKSRVEENSKPKNDREPIPNKSIKLDDKEFQELLSSENFSKIYTQFLIEMPEYTARGLQETRGTWQKYSQGSDAHPLVQSLDGHPLEWCTADLDTAQSQLKGGDFYVYYSIDQQGKPTVPRVAIRMQGDSIAEVRGIAEDQNLDRYINDVIKEKLVEFPDGKAYEKKSADMKLLTEVERKTKINQPLGKDELQFLYEIKAPIEGFGYSKDPRIEELLERRDSEADMLIALDCTPEQIARNASDLERPDIKAYVGPFFPDFFKKLPAHIHNVYERFPDKPVIFKGIVVGGKTREQLRSDITASGIVMSSYAEDIFKKVEVGRTPHSVELVIISVSQLGFPQGETRQKIYEKAIEFGLELAPAEVGPQLRLQYIDQPQGEWLRIGMEPITDRDGAPAVFGVARRGAERWLRDYDGHPDGRWDDDDDFVFVRRK